MSVKAYGVLSLPSGIEPLTIERRSVGLTDVDIDILYCGVCHSDLHQVRGETSWLTYPLVPGHEIIGRVAAVGKDVSRFVVGDTVGVGCMVGSCKRCSECDQGFEQFCETETTFTYGSPSADYAGHTLGGYSQKIVVDQDFVLKITHGVEDLAAAAPLLCAGITMYSPLRDGNVGPGKTVGLVGIGGLGHMGVKLARAMGAHVVGLTTSEAKIPDILALGAQEAVVWKNDQDLAAREKSFDLIINTVSASHDLDPFLRLLKRSGKMTMVGVPKHPHPSPSVWELIWRQRSIGGSLIGGIARTQEMLDFCAAHRIVSEIETIAPAQIEAALQRLERGDVKYRFVIDMSAMNKDGLQFKPAIAN